jgi:hypothetical protein
MTRLAVAAGGSGNAAPGGLAGPPRSRCSYQPPAGGRQLAVASYQLMAAT